MLRRLRKWRVAGQSVVMATALVAMTLVVGGASPTYAAPAPSGNLNEVYAINYQDNWWFPLWTTEYCNYEGGVFNLTYQPLLYLGNNGLVDYSYSVASGITVSDNDTVFTVHIGSRWKWSNGEPVTAYDAAYTANIILAGAKPHAPWEDCGTGTGGLPTDWKSIAAPNAHTMVITTTRPVNPLWFEENSLAEIVPVPKSVWDHEGTNWNAELKWILSVATHPNSPELKVVDGPYTLGKFVNDDYETLIANPSYTGPDPARIKTITYYDLTSESSELALALRGGLSEFAIPAQYAGDTAELERAGYRIVTNRLNQGISYTAVNFNRADPMAKILDQLYIRQALQYGINERGEVQLAHGYGFQGYGPISPIPKTIFYDPEEARVGYHYDPAKGLHLLEAHGWHLKNGVMTNAAGQTLSFTLLYLPGNQWVQNCVELWQTDLKQEGIVLKLEPNAEAGTLVTTTHTWELAFLNTGTYSWSYAPDYYPTGYGLFGIGSAENYGDFSNAQLTKLILATHAPGPQKVQLQRMFAYEVYAAKILPVLWMAPQVGMVAIRKNLQEGAVSTFMGWTLFNFWHYTSAKS